LLAPLDEYRGVFRYHVCYNMVVLRMISYGLDQHWHRVGKGLARAVDGGSADRLTYKSRTLELQPGASACPLPPSPHHVATIASSFPFFKWVDHTRLPRRSASHARSPFGGLGAVLLGAEDSFSLSYYYEYLFYPPLYLAGPILTFNAFASQMRRPQTTYRLPAILKYIARLLASWLALEVRAWASVQALHSLRGERGDWSHSLRRERVA
jgi:hypothetical protein